MTKEFDLDFCFKGSRDYVHGTDIYTKLIEQHQNAKNIDIAFHGISLKNLTFFREKPKEEVKVTFRCLENKNKIKLFGVENTSNIDCRYEYIEKKIIHNTTVDRAKEKITLYEKTEYLLIEHIVAMNKVLLEKLYDISGKWYFTRLQLKENIAMSNISSLQLILKSNFQFKLTKTTIIVNNKEIGFIYFSFIPKEP